MYSYKTKQPPWAGQFPYSYKLGCGFDPAFLRFITYLMRVCVVGWVADP